MEIIEIVHAMLQWFDNNIVAFSSFIFALFLVEVVTILLGRITKFPSDERVLGEEELPIREIRLFGFIFYVLLVGFVGVLIQDKLGEIIGNHRERLAIILATLTFFTYLFAIFRVGYAPLKKYDLTICGLLALIALAGYYFNNKAGLTVLIAGLFLCYLRRNSLIYDKNKNWWT
jgi:hypothetical protein